MGSKVTKSLTLEMMEKCDYDDLVNQTEYSINIQNISIEYSKLKSTLRPIGFPLNAIEELMEVKYCKSSRMQHFNFRSNLDTENVVLIIGKARNSIIPGYINLAFAKCDATAFLKKQYMYVVETTTKKGKVVKQEVIKKIQRPLTGQESIKIHSELKAISTMKANNKLGY